MSGRLPWVVAGRGRGEFVGRTAELDGVRQVIDEALTGRPAMVLITGEAGIGKTHLADEAGENARAAGMRVIRGEADPDRREQMELWRGVYRALGVEPPADPNLAANERRWEHLEALTGALAAAGQVLVILDDLHWADDTAIWVAERLPRALVGSPVAVVATTRDREPDMPRLDRLRRVCDVIPLDGLAVDDVRALASRRGHAAVDAAELHDRTGGNPLFVRELLDAPDRNVVIGEVLDVTLDRLDDETMAIVAHAAVAGPTTPLHVLAASAGVAVGSIADRLATAVDARVLDEVGADGVHFRHSLLREAAIERSDVRDIHHRLSQAWELVPGGRVQAVVHGLHAVPATQAGGAIASAQAVASELATAGQRARAAGLLRDAADVAAEAGFTTQRAGLLLDLGDVLVSLDDAGAGDVYELARQLLGTEADPTSLARAEVGAAMQHRSFQSDPARRRRLERALTGVPDDADRLRAALCGRLAVVTGADPDAADESRQWAEKAIEAARRSGDPVLIAQALLDRYMTPVSPTELDEQAQAAIEVIVLAERAGRHDLAIQGHQWLVSHHLNHGDPTSAEHHLQSADVLAALQPAPIWRYSVLVRRVTSLALRGDRDSVSSATAAAVELGRDWMDAVGLWGFELGHRCMLADLFGVDEPRLGELFERLNGLVGHAPVPFLQINLGWAALLVGDQRTARDVVERYAPVTDLVLRSLSGDSMLRTLGELVVRTGATVHADAVYRALAPFSGMLGVGNAAMAGMPVDDVLARLAALVGNNDRALDHARRGVELARALQSPPLHDRCLGGLAVATERAGGVATAQDADVPDPATTIAGTPRAATIRAEARRWIVTSPLGNTVVPASAGMAQLARLLGAPGIEISAVDLAGGVEAPPTGDFGPALDARAKRAYRSRLNDLRSELDRADATGDADRGARAQHEIDALLAELSRATGLGGRDRPMGATAERARINVVRSLKRAISAISQLAPDLARHLEVSVRTGGFCSYAPEPAAALDWTVQSSPPG